MLVGYYKGRKFYFNEFLMEIYEEKDGKLIKKRDFHKWERLVSWKRVYNPLAKKILNEGAKPEWEVVG